VKYGSRGLTFKVKDTKLDNKVIDELSHLAEHSIARKTWDTYRTAERMLLKFGKEKKATLDWPLQEEIILRFVHWLICDRGLSAASVSSYLAGVKKLHVIKGMEEPKIRTSLVQMIIEGKKNIEAAEKVGYKDKRQPVTPEIMALLKARINEWEVETLDKLTVWAVCTLLFHGAFRGAELLARNATWFDPSYTLLKRDVCIAAEKDGKAVVQVLVKAPKESKSGSSTVVDIFQMDTAMCPTRAVKKWWSASKKMAPDQPAFRLSSGVPLTSSKLNQLLHLWLDDAVPGITTHSFRIGAASLMVPKIFFSMTVRFC
jgi:hypothetical protein